MYFLLQQYLSRHINLTDEQFASFCQVFKHKTIKRNDVLLHAGEVCRYMFFINKGCLRVYLVDQDGRESTRFLITEGRFGTAFPSFILQEPSLASIQSIEPSEVLMLTYSDFRQLPNLLPGWEELYRNSLESDYIASIKRIESLITMSAKDRYAMLLKERPELIKRLPSKIIADYLGISQETLSRLKSKP
jgi:CRP-like cAMP-binding protein